MDLSQPPSNFSPALDTRDTERRLAAVSALPPGRFAHWEMLRLLSALQRSPPLAPAYLKVLEAVHAALADAQLELAGRHVAVPLPPDEPEKCRFRDLVSLWRRMARGYAQVARLGGNSPLIQDCLALICQRCLLYTGRGLIEHFRTRRTLAPGLWAELHGYYHTAEELGLARLQVPYAPDPGAGFSNCTDTYAAVLLVDLADPYGRNPRELSLIVRWVADLAPLTDIVKPSAPDDVSCYGIDLTADRGLRPADGLAFGEALRHFDTSRLAPHLQALLNQLGQQVPPASLGFGPDCKKAVAGRLLLQLRRRLAPTPRRYQRHAASGTLSVCCGFPAIHHFVNTDETLMPGNDYAMEQWQIADQSLNGLHLLRGPAGPRLERAELLGIRLPSGGHFLLAKMVWLTLEADDHVHVGLQLMPGRPQAIRISVSASSAMSATISLHGFLLPALPALGKQSSLVVPRGVFHPGSIIEIHNDRAQRIRLTRRLKRGADFEQIAFVAA